MEITGALQTAWQKVMGWGEAFIQALPNLAAAILVFVLFWMLGGFLKKLVHRALRASSVHDNAVALLARFAAIAAIATGIFLALGILNLDKALASLLAGAGIVGLAIGFAAQDSGENLIAGILISLRRPFELGHLIESADHYGKVEEINLRSTIVRTPQGQSVIIPNSTIYQNPLVNYSDLGSRRVDLGVGVSYADDLAKARDVAVKAVEGVEGRDESRDVELFYEEFGGSSINFTVRFWIPFAKGTDFHSARSEAVMRIKEAFDTEGITIPFPIRTMDFGIEGGRTLAQELEDRQS